MRVEIKQRILRLLNTDLSHAEDNVARARMQFSGYSSEQMNREYGNSGETCSEILGVYTRWHDETKEAIAEIQSL